MTDATMQHEWREASTQVPPTYMEGAWTSGMCKHERSEWCAFSLACTHTSTAEFGGVPKPSDSHWRYFSYYMHLKFGSKSQFLFADRVLAIGPS